MEILDQPVIAKWGRDNPIMSLIHSKGVLTNKPKLTLRSRTDAAAFVSLASFFEMQFGQCQQMSLNLGRGGGGDGL